MEKVAPSHSIVTVNLQTMWLLPDIELFHVCTLTIFTLDTYKLLPRLPVN
jgi:hypothetical protein